MIKLPPGGLLHKFRRFGVQHYNASRKHCRKPHFCFPTRTSLIPHWKQRRTKRRYIRRMKRIQKMWEPFMKPKRLTPLEEEEKRKKDLLEDLRERCKRMCPKFLMKQKHLRGNIIDVFEAYARKSAIRKQKLIDVSEEFIFLRRQLKALTSKASLYRMSREVGLVEVLINKKIQGDLDYKEALALRKLMKRRITERKKDFVNLMVILASYYKKTKHNENLTVPKFFTVVEKNRFQEKSFGSKRTAKQLYLEAVAATNRSYMELKTASDELFLYVRTRSFFLANISKILNKLNSAKDIVIKLFRDGHEQLTNMFKMLHDIEATKNAQENMSELVSHRLELEHYREVLKAKVESEYMRHTTYKYPKACLVKFFHNSQINNLLLKLDTKDNSGLYVNYLTLERKEFLDRFMLGKHWGKREVLSYSGEKNIDIWDDFKADISWNDFALAHILPRNNMLLFHLVNAPQRHYWERKSKHLDKLMYNCYCLNFKRFIAMSYNIIYNRYIHILAIIGFLEKLEHLTNDEEISRHIKRAMPFIFNQAKRKKGHRAGQLGIHHKFVFGNKDQCITTVFKYFYDFIAIRDVSMPDQEYSNIIIGRRKRAKAKRNKKLLELTMPKYVTKAMLKNFSFNDINNKEYCILCVCAERAEIVKRKDEYIEIRNLAEIRKEAWYLILGPKKEFLIHDFEHCPQPAELWVHSLRILKDRSRLEDLEAWIKWE